MLLILETDVKDEEEEEEEEDEEEVKSFVKQKSSITS